MKSIYVKYIVIHNDLVLQLCQPQRQTIPYDTAENINI